MMKKLLILLILCLLIPSVSFSWSYRLADDGSGVIGWHPTYPTFRTIDGGAAVRLEGVDLSPYAGVAGASTPCRIVVDDSGPDGILGNVDDREIYGYLAEADSALALGSELIVNGDFAAALGAEWDLTIAGGGGSITIVAEELKFTQVTSAGMRASQDFSTVVGKLYKYTADIKTNESSGFLKVYVGTNQNGHNIYNSGYIATTGVKTVYFIATTTTTWITVGDFQDNNRASTWDDVSCKEVTHLGTDGCLVVSAKNGSTRNWNKDAGFNLNDPAGYGVKVYCFDPVIKVR